MVVVGGGVVVVVGGGVVGTGVVVGGGVVGDGVVVGGGGNPLAASTPPPAPELSVSNHCVCGAPETGGKGDRPTPGISIGPCCQTGGKSLIVFLIYPLRLRVFILGNERWLGWAGNRLRTHFPTREMLLSV